VTDRFGKSMSLQGYPACDDKVSEISREIWDSGKYKGRIFGDVAAAMRELGIKPDFAVLTGNGSEGTKVLHRHSAEADLYFVANRLDKPRNVTVDFRIQGKQPELWQAEDASIHDAPAWCEKEGVTSVTLSLGARQSVFVVFRRAVDPSDHPVSVSVSDESASWSIGHDADGKPCFQSPEHLTATVSYFSGKQKPITTSPIPSSPINGPWDVSFKPKLGDPFTLVFPELLDFSNHADNRVKYFSGTAVYSKTLRVESSQLAANPRILLDLGTMNDIAKVKVNGRDGTVLWYAPYVMDVTGLLHPGENRLEIEVTNTWANALIGDEQIPPDFKVPKDFDWGKNRYGYQIPEFPDWFVKGENRPSARKTFTTWIYHNKESKLQPAGLVGPVCLRFENRIGL
jgi:alpha-L-rhamnosidase